MDRLAGSRYFLEAPSTASKPSNFLEWQASDDRILNDRPHKDVEVPPIELLYPPFGKFIDQIHNCPEKEPGVNLREFQFAVDAFASVMCNHFMDEHERQEAVLWVLNNIFRCYEPLGLPDIFSKEETKSHAPVYGTPVMETIVEIKNEFGFGQTDPEIQLISYFLQMNYFHMHSTRPYKESFKKFLCPVLGITIIGSYIGFGALLLLNQPRYVALTPLLSARSPSGDDTNRPALFHAFRAACVLRHNIYDDIRHVIDDVAFLPSICDRTLPRIQSIPTWPETDNSELELSILGVAFQARDMSWNENRFMYHARTRHGVVLVKFTRSYNPKLHGFCAKKHHAPKLLGYGAVPGGWKVVVMELVKHDPINRTLHAPKYWETWEQGLTSLVRDFHEQGLVHGDLRTANFIVPTSEPQNILLIDFDWAGEVGKVRFPTWLLNTELMDGTEVESLLITKEHDIRVFNAALEGLKPLDTVPSPSTVLARPSDVPGPSTVSCSFNVPDPSTVPGASSNRKRKASPPSQPTHNKAARGSTTSFT